MRLAPPLDIVGAAMRRTRLSFSIHRAIASLVRHAPRWRPTALEQIAADSKDPFRVLISCLLSLRTKDAVTETASARLFRLADTPERMLRLTVRRIEKAIYPVGFYHTKARTLLTVCRLLLTQHSGRVPDTIEELLTLPGVGRKTANLVVTLGYGKPGICVDTHVHRITNRWGYVRTTTPEKTEEALRDTLPRRYWIPLNDLLVSFGQNVCKPISPLCSQCPLDALCPKIGVTIHR